MKNINGTVKISDEIIINIAGFSALETEGVDSVIGFSNDAINSSKSVTDPKSITMAFKDNDLDINMIIDVKYGYSIPDVCLQVQNSIKEQIKSMTGLNTRDINILVNNIVR